MLWERARVTWLCFSLAALLFVPEPSLPAG